MDDQLKRLLVGKTNGFQVAFSPRIACEGCKNWKAFLFFEACGAPYLVEDGYTGDSYHRKVHSLTESREVSYCKSVGPVPTPMRMVREASDMNKKKLMANEISSALMSCVLLVKTAQLVVEKGKALATGIFLLKDDGVAIGETALNSDIVSLLDWIDRQETQSFCKETDDYKMHLNQSSLESYRIK